MPHCTHDFANDYALKSFQDEKNTVNRNWVSFKKESPYKQTNNREIPNPIIENKKHQLQLADKMQKKVCRDFMMRKSEQMKDVQFKE